MKQISALNSKQVKSISAMIKKQFAADFDFSQYALIMNSQDKLNLANKELFSLDFSKLRANSIGMYFASLQDGALRLSIEGSQLVGKLAKKNIVELDDAEFQQWIKGIDLDKTLPQEVQNQFIIIKHADDFVGCGKAKENKILNYVPKIRRLMAKV